MNDRMKRKSSREDRRRKADQGAFMKGRKEGMGRPILLRGSH